MRRGERGANLAEFAIGALFLVILLMGVADVGRALYDQMVITNAVREGARFAVRYPLESVDAVRAKVRQEILNQDASLSCPTGNIQVSQESDATGKAKRVRVTCTFTTITPFFNSFDLQAEAVMKVEGPS
jgi:Flp pilus assembly protein TadG